MSTLEEVFDDMGRNEGLRLLKQDLKDLAKVKRVLRDKPVKKSLGVRKERKDRNT